MMVYFTGSTYNQIIRECIKKVDELIFEESIDDNQDFYKYMKQNITNLGGVDCLILDVSVCLNTDEEVLSALEMIRTMYDKIKIIVFAPYYKVGNAFLMKCLQMGICNIVNTDDFRQIEIDLTYCLKDGMTYRDAAKFKEVYPEKVVVKHAIKRTVNKRLIGVAGTESNIGTTHSSIVLANYFRRKGFMVALAERAEQKAFVDICKDYDERIFEGGYFTLNGIDFWPDVSDEKMQLIQTHSYNVIVIDFGCYQDINKDAFERCEDRLIITGAKPWEMESINRIFSMASKDVLRKYVFLFNFTPQRDYEAIQKGMDELSVYFLNYMEDPFMAFDFPGGDEIFEAILPEETQKEEKRGMISKIFKKSKRQNTATEHGPLESCSVPKQCVSEMNGPQT